MADVRDGDELHDVLHTLIAYLRTRKDRRHRPSGGQGSTAVAGELALALSDEASGLRG